MRKYILTVEDIEGACQCEKLNKVESLVDELIQQYEDDHNEVLKAYENKEIPTCMKVEAETVYFNMVKILKKIKETINE